MHNIVIIPCYWKHFFYSVSNFVGKKPGDLLNPKAVNSMQSLFAVKDTLGKRETREISALCGLTVTQVCSFSRMCCYSVCTFMSYMPVYVFFIHFSYDWFGMELHLHLFTIYKWTVAIELGSSLTVSLYFPPFYFSLIGCNMFGSCVKHELMISFEFPFPWVVIDKLYLNGY